MTTVRTLRRPRDRRFPIEPTSRTRIEFEDALGELRSLPIVDFSAAGLSFVSDDRVPGAETGRRIEGVTVHVGDCSIAGRFDVRHTTERGDFTICYGGILYPANESELLKLNGVIAALGACRTRD